MHSFRLTSKLPTLESNVHLGFASGGHHFVGLTNPYVNRERLHQLYNVQFLC